MDIFKKLLRGVTAAMLAVGLLAGGVTGTANADDYNTYDLWFGDSQMYGQGIEGDAVRSEKRFSKLVSDADNAIEVNVAVSGAHWTGGNNRFGVQIDKLIGQYSGKNVRRIIGQGVYNDCPNITANSTDVQVRNVAQQITDTTKPYYAKLRRAFPDAQIAYIPQVAVWGTVQKNNAKFANIVKVGRYVSEGLKNQGWTVMDMDDDLGMLVGRQEYLADSIHINIAGHAMAAQGIISWLNTTSPTVSKSTPTGVTYRPKVIDIVSGEDVSYLIRGKVLMEVVDYLQGSIVAQKIETGWANMSGEIKEKYDYVGVDPNSSYLKHNPTEFANSDYWTINTDESMKGKVYEQKLLVKAKHIVNVTYVDANTNQPVKAYTNVIGPLPDHSAWSVVLWNAPPEEVKDGYPYPSEYAFVGLSNQSDGTVYQQTDGVVSVRGTADKEINNVIALISHVITYNANGGTGSMSATKTCEPVAASTFTRSGYQFTGWNTRADGTGQNVNAGDTASFTANTTLYAQWQATSHTVTFDTNGGNAIAPQTVENGKTTSRPNATRNGYTLDGWYLDGTKYGFNTPVTRDITLKASWRKTGVTTVKANLHKRLATGSKSGRYKLTLDVKDTDIATATMRNTVISDPLSKWVDPVGLADGKDTGITVTKDGKTMTSGYTAMYDAKTRTVKVALPGDLADNSTYQVAFEVSLSDTARLDYMRNGTYPDTSDADTGLNAGKKGYCTNGNATLTWDAVTTVDGVPTTVPSKAAYPKPVATWSGANLPAPSVLTNHLPGTGGTASLIPVIAGMGIAIAIAAVWVIRRYLI